MAGKLPPRKTTPGGKDIFLLLCDHRNSRCSDDRDRLLSLFGAASNIERNDPQGPTQETFGQRDVAKIRYKPDYSLSVDQAYHGFAQAALQTAYAYHLLISAAIFSHPDTEHARPFPSWVLHWRILTPHCEEDRLALLLEPSQIVTETALKLDPFGWYITTPGMLLGIVEDNQIAPQPCRSIWRATSWATGDKISVGQQGRRDCSARSQGWRLSGDIPGCSQLFSIKAAEWSWGSSSSLQVYLTL